MNLWIFIISMLIFRFYYLYSIFWVFIYSIVWTSLSLYHILIFFLQMTFKIFFLSLHYILKVLLSLSILNFCLLSLYCIFVCYLCAIRSVLRFYFIYITFQVLLRIFFFHFYRILCIFLLLPFYIFFGHYDLWITFKENFLK